MYSDPGWSAAFRKLGTALLNPAKLSRTRPAITAARARMLPVLLSIPVLLNVLPRLHGNESGTADGLFMAAGVLVVLLAASGFFWVLLAPRRFFRHGDLAAGFLSAHALIVGFGTGPMMWGFLGFFIVGSVWPFVVTGALTVILLLGIGRPTEALARRWGERLDRLATPESLWLAVLEPE